MEVRAGGRCRALPQGAGGNRGQLRGLSQHAAEKLHQNDPENEGLGQKDRVHEHQGPRRVSRSVLHQPGGRA